MMTITSSRTGPVGLQLSAEKRLMSLTFCRSHAPPADEDLMHTVFCDGSISSLKVRSLWFLFISANSVQLLQNSQKPHRQLGVRAPTPRLAAQGS